MVIKCEGCRTLVEIDPDTGHTRASGGVTGVVVFVDQTIVVWNCPVCDYPHSNRTAEPST